MYIEANVIKGYLLDDVVDQFGRILLKKRMPLDTQLEEKLKKLGVEYNYINVEQTDTNTVFDHLSTKIIEMPKDIDSKFTEFTSAVINKAVNYMNDLFWKLNTDSFFRDIIGGVQSNNAIYTHSINVAILSTCIGQKLNFNERQLQNLTIAALCHDIGLIFLQPTIKISDISRILDFENTHDSEMHQHVIIGSNAIKVNKLPAEIYNAVAQHHERYDGKGFPNKISGDKISLNAMIISICNIFDILTTDGKECKNLNPDEAMGELLKYNGKLFSPQIVAQFYAIFKFEN